VADTGFTILEEAVVCLVQVSGWDDSLAAACDACTDLFAVPGSVGGVVEERGLTVIRTEPRQFWVLADAAPHLAQTLHERIRDDHGAVVDLGHARTRFVVAGTGAARSLCRDLPLDLEGGAPAPGAAAQSVIRHVPVLIHRRTVTHFVLYVPTSYRRWLRDWIEDKDGLVRPDRIDATAATARAQAVDPPAHRP
jgi:heterotetrameric sarcosine oxidase gamma subunit